MLNLVGLVVVCRKCGDRDLGPWSCETGLCELCESHRTADRELARRVQILGTTRTIDDAARRIGIERRTLLRWMTPLRLRAVRIIAERHWRDEQLIVAKQCALVDAPGVARLLETLQEPWVLQYVRTYWAHWPR